MKELPERIKFKVKDSDEEHVVVRERIPETMGLIGYRYEGETEVPSYFAESLVRNSIETGHWIMIEEAKPFEIPASPFYVSIRKPYRTDRESFRIDVDGLRYKATAVEGREVFICQDLFTRDIPGLFASGAWKLIEAPAPAVDPVVAATAEVQRLLREYQAAVIANDEADDISNKAAENRRNIGKQLEEAKRALGNAMCVAAGVTSDDEELPF